MEIPVTIPNNDVNLKTEDNNLTTKDNNLTTKDINLTTKDINLKDENIIKNINNLENNNTINLGDLSVEEIKTLLDYEMEKFPINEQEFLDYIDDMIYPKIRKDIKK